VKRNTYCSRAFTVWSN